MSERHDSFTGGLGCADSGVDVTEFRLLLPNAVETDKEVGTFDPTNYKRGFKKERQTNWSVMS